MSPHPIVPINQTLGEAEEADWAILANFNILSLYEHKQSEINLEN